MHLHTHSNHSLLEGVGGIRQLVARAVEHGMKSLALTDTGGMYGAIPFYEAAREAGIQPILGVELDGAVLLARDREGYACLCRAVTAWKKGDCTKRSESASGDGTVPLFQLAEHVDPAHVFVMVSDEAQVRALRTQGIAPLVAITHYGDRRSRYRADRLRAYALRHDLRPVAVNPVYFLDPDHYRVHRVLAAIRLNTTVDNLKAGDVAPAESWFRSPKTMRGLYGDWPETLTNLEWVAEHCDLKLNLGKPLFPGISLPGGETPFSTLWKRAFEGIKGRYRPLTPKVTQRLQYELDIIEKLGFAAYFLIVADIVAYARGRDIPIMGRGSAANSIVAYALGITRADPMKYDLYFERFLNLHRTDCPDIDLDICWRRRDDVIDYVYETYGADRVAMICTLNTFQARSAVREVAKALGMTQDEVSVITRQLPHYHARDIRSVVRFLPECRSLRIDEEPLKSIVSISEFIDGFPRHLSIHAGGLVIAPRPLTDFTPLQQAAKGLRITQYDMGPIEKLGLVKMDLLGHRSLTVIDETVQKVWDNRGIRVDVERLPDPDPLTGDLIRCGRTIGCFQIESPAMRALLRHTLADNTDMLIKTLSLIRPGPSGSGMKKAFIARHLGKEDVVHLHPDLEPVLGDTYGVMLYQEDILKVASVIAGMDLAEADGLRRAMSKKGSAREMARSMKVFIEKAVARGVEEAVAEEIWERMANFAAYSYCKAHACTYGEVAYQCTYLKAHFPAEFLSSVLSNRGGFYEPPVYLEEAKRLGIAVHGPDVNRSPFGYAVEGDAIRVGFVEIRGLTQATVEAILETRKERPFRSLTDLFRRTRMPYADADLLIQSGACDGFGEPRPVMFWRLKLLMPGRGRGAEVPERSLFPDHESADVLPRIPDYSRRKQLDQELELLHLLPSSHPLEYYLPPMTDRTLVLSGDLPKYVGRVITMAGWLIAERSVGLKERGAMKFLTFEDLEGVFEVVAFPEAYQRCGHVLGSHGPYFVHGLVQEEDNYCSVTLDALERIARPA
jgi:DNA polymerase III subunit alpha